MPSRHRHRVFHERRCRPGFAHAARAPRCCTTRMLNKGTAFSDAERDVLGLRGLLPPHVCTLEEQVARVLENFRRKPTRSSKYIFMAALHDRNEALFYPRPDRATRTR